MGDIYYHEECRDCEYLWHCFGPDTAARIQDGDTDGATVYPWRCSSYYPEVKA